MLAISSSSDALTPSTTNNHMPPAAAAAAAKALPVVAAGVLAASAVLPAYADGDLEAGKAVFSGNCAACHKGGRNIIQQEKTLQLAALEQYLDGGANPAAVKKQVVAHVSSPSTCAPARRPATLFAPCRLSCRSDRKSSAPARALQRLNA